MKNDEKRDLLAAFGMVGSIGLNMVATIGVGLFIGRLIDSWLASTPWATAGGIILGMLSGLWAVYKRVMGKY